MCSNFFSITAVVSRFYINAASCGTLRLAILLIRYVSRPAFVSRSCVIVCVVQHRDSIDATADHNTMNRKLIFSLSLVVLSLLTVGIVVLQIDDDLDPGAAQWIEKIQVEKSSDAYLYLLGIVAAKGENPKQVGKEIYDSIRVAEQQSSNVTLPIEYADYPQENKLALPSGDLCCATSEEGCFKKIFQNTAALESELHQHALLLSRYRTFIKLNDYAILSRPAMLEPLPPYQYLSAANRLAIFDAITKAEGSAPIEAINGLLSNITRV